MESGRSMIWLHDKEMSSECAIYVGI